MPPHPVRDGQWLIARDNARATSEVLALVLAREPHPEPHPEPRLERISSFPSERTKWAPDDATILQHVRAGIASANADFDTQFVPIQIRCEAYNTSRPTVYERLAYDIIEAGFRETGRHTNLNPSRAGRPDFRLPVARAQVLRDVAVSSPSHGRLAYAYDRLDNSLFYAVLAELRSPAIAGDWQSLSLPRRSFAAVRILVGEVMNGGFEQYFYNSSGESARDGLEGLEFMGATNYSRVVHAAIGRFPNDGVPRDQAARWELLRGMQPDAQDQFDPLDREFFGLDSTGPSLESLVLRMLLEHQAEFFA